MPKILHIETKRWDAWLDRITIDQIKHLSKVLQLPQREIVAMSVGQFYSRLFPGGGMGKEGPDKE
jgi:hypothetical protein